MASSAMAVVNDNPGNSTMIAASVATGTCSGCQMAAMQRDEERDDRARQRGLNVAEIRSSTHDDTDQPGQQSRHRRNCDLATTASEQRRRATADQRLAERVQKAAVGTWRHHPTHFLTPALWLDPAAHDAVADVVQRRESAQVVIARRHPQQRRARFFSRLADRDEDRRRRREEVALHTERTTARRHRVLDAVRSAAERMHRAPKLQHELLPCHQY